MFRPAPINSDDSPITLIKQFETRLKTHGDLKKKQQMLESMRLLLDKVAQDIVFEGKTYDFNTQFAAFEWTIRTYIEHFSEPMLLTDLEYVAIAAVMEECALPTIELALDGYQDIDVYECTYKELAMHFVKDGLMGDVTEKLALYIDYELLGQDLKSDYCEFVFSDKKYLIRNV